MPPPLHRTCRLFLFDLDGTLIDSKADLSNTVNLALARMKMLPLPVCRVAEFVGDGVQKLIQRTLREVVGTEPESALIQRAADLFQEEYANHLLDTTCLYPGVKEALDRLSWAEFAVVSNKPERFSRRILEGLGVADRFCSILGEDSTPRRKPDPAPLLKAMEICKVVPSETVMVGDSPVDIAAGKAAGVITCGILGGYRSRKELEAAGCDLIVTSILELADQFHPPPSTVAD